MSKLRELIIYLDLSELLELDRRTNLAEESLVIDFHEFVVELADEGSLVLVGSLESLNEVVTVGGGNDITEVEGSDGNEAVGGGLRDVLSDLLGPESRDLEVVDLSGLSTDHSGDDESGGVGADVVVVELLELDGTEDHTVVVVLLIVLVPASIALSRTPLGRETLGDTVTDESTLLSGGAVLALSAVLEDELAPLEGILPVLALKTTLIAEVDGVVEVDVDDHTGVEDGGEVVAELADDVVGVAEVLDVLDDLGVLVDEGVESDLEEGGHGVLLVVGFVLDFGDGDITEPGGHGVEEGVEDVVLAVEDVVVVDVVEDVGDVDTHAADDGAGAVVEVVDPTLAGASLGGVAGDVVLLGIGAGVVGGGAEDSLDVVVGPALAELLAGVVLAHALAKNVDLVLSADGLLAAVVVLSDGTEAGAAVTSGAGLRGVGLAAALVTVEDVGAGEAGLAGLAVDVDQSAVGAVALNQVAAGLADGAGTGILVGIGEGVAGEGSALEAEVTSLADGALVVGVASGGIGTHVSSNSINFGVLAGLAGRKAGLVGVGATDTGSLDLIDAVVTEGAINAGFTLLVLATGALGKGDS